MQFLTRLVTFIMAVVLAVALVQRAAAQDQRLTVFAAASLKTALDEVVEEFERDTGIEVAVSYAGSSRLARQVQQGAPADLFISASVAWMDVVEESGDIVAGSRRNLLGNRLVLVAHGTEASSVSIGQSLDLAGMLGDGRLAMALVDSVPAGIYGKQALVTLGLWDSVKDQVAQADNVRAALALVARGEAPYGIVYATDAIAEPGVSLVGRFADDTHDPIVYPVALTTQARGAAPARFLEALASERAVAVFEKNGFVALGK